MHGLVAESGRRVLHERGVVAELRAKTGSRLNTRICDSPARHLQAGIRYGFHATSGDVVAIEGRSENEAYHAASCGRRSRHGSVGNRKSR